MWICMGVGNKKKLLLTILPPSLCQDEVCSMIHHTTESGHKDKCSSELFKSDVNRKITQTKWHMS